MRGRPGALVLAVLLAVTPGASGCGDAKEKAQGDASTRAERERDVLAKRERRLSEALARTDSGAPDPTPVARWLLPNSLMEISGLALTADERLLAHDDAHGLVSEIDYRRGTIVKRFQLSPAVNRVDFEGITVANGVVFMLASNGTLYEFAEGDDGARVPYTVHDTQLGKECEFEGVAFDPAIGSLLLACKIVNVPALSDSLVIYRWKLQTGLTRAARLSRLTVPVALVVGSRDWKSVHPSDITIDPKSGNYVIVASKDHATIEITPAGALVAARLLPGEHPQAEGIAITRDRVLIVSDEAVRGPAVITLYRLP